jgi:hypothetical protein
VSKDYRIHASDIVEKGVQQVVFNPDLIEVFVSDKQIGEWGGEGYQRVSVVYKDEDLAQLMAVNNYYIDWAKTIFKGDHQDRYRHNRKAIKFHKSLSVNYAKNQMSRDILKSLLMPLRKKPRQWWINIPMWILSQRN